jgi:poly(A) polymerase
VKRIIHRAYVIGKRFRLVLVRRDEQQFEVATFRRDIREDENAEDLPPGDNIFGTPEDDAHRRDFTINALFYDPINDQLIDFAEGRADLEAGWVRMIGDPMKRLIEDPIRIMRALRLKHMIDFRLDPALREAMGKCAHSLTTTALPRRREEILKWLRLKRPELAFREACDMGILEHLSPTLHKLMESETGDAFLSSLSQMRDFVPKDSSPPELFAYLVHCFVRSSLQVDPVTTARPRELAANEELHVWMRDELGMFKFEQALTVKALHVEPLLSRRREFQRKGERRQKALLTNEAFPLALGFAKRDYLLNCEDLLYWNQQYEALRRNGGGPVIGENSAKRRRRRRPRRGKPRSSDAGAENMDAAPVSLEGGGAE